jgi:hypothetical protein
MPSSACANGPRLTPLGLTRLGPICLAPLCTSPLSRKFGPWRFGWLNWKDGHTTMSRKCWPGPIDTSQLSSGSRSGRYETGIKR